MNQPVVSVGSQILVITRKLYADDLRRHFIGRVKGFSDGLILIEGHAWVANAIGKFERRPDLRTRVIAATSGTEIMIMVPDDVDLDQLDYRTTMNERLVLTDGHQFRLDLSEFAPG